MRRQPPHAPTARHPVTDSLSQYFNDSEAYLLADIATNLVSKQVGYPHVSFLSLPGGITAIATPFERITRDGRAVWRDRFNFDPSSRPTPLGSKPVPVHACALIYFIKPNANPISVGESPKSFSRHRAALEAGAHQMNDDWKFGTVTQRHRVEVFAYEYRGDGLSDPVFVPTSTLKVLDHLVKRGIVPVNR